MTNDSSKNVKIFGRERIFLGKTWEDWTINWWQWLVSIPKQKNPANDRDGRYCGINQLHDIWFLAGTTGGSAIRSCVIPSKRTILLPIIATLSSYAKYPALKYNETELRLRAKSQQDKVRDMRVRIDNGLTLNRPELEEYRVQSPIFHLTLPENNLLGLEPGITEAISDGRWLLLELSTGLHEVHSYATEVDPEFETDVTYIIDSIA